MTSNEYSNSCNSIRILSKRSNSRIVQVFVSALILTLVLESHEHASNEQYMSIAASGRADTEVKMVLNLMSTCFTLFWLVRLSPVDSQDVGPAMQLQCWK